MEEPNKDRGARSSGVQNSFKTACLGSVGEIRVFSRKLSTAGLKTCFTATEVRTKLVARLRAFNNKISSNVVTGKISK